MLGYVSKGAKPNKEQQAMTEKMVRCIAYDPLERVYYIEKNFQGVPFKRYSIYHQEVEYYVRGKMKRRHWGYFKHLEHPKQQATKKVASHNKKSKGNKTHGHGKQKLHAARDV